MSELNRKFEVFVCIVRATDVSLMEEGRLDKVTLQVLMCWRDVHRQQDDNQSNSANNSTDGGSGSFEDTLGCESVNVV